MASALNALENQIHEVSGQTGQFQRERLTEILTGRKPRMVKIPMKMKIVVLTWLTACHRRGLTARELFNDRDSLQECSGTKLPWRVEAYSMLLVRLDKRYVTRVKQGKEFRYHTTMDGFRHLLDLIRLEKVAEKSRKKEKESKERAFLASQRTKITNLQMEQLQVLIEKIPGIMDTTDALEIYSTWGRTLLEAAESIRALQI